MRAAIAGASRVVTEAAPAVVMSRRATIPSLLLALSACCAGGGDWLTFGLGPGDSRSVPPWSRAVTYRVSDRPALDADFEPAHPLAGAPFECFRDDGATPVVLSCATRRIDNATRNGCGLSDQVTCDLGALGPGRYVIVHRRAHGNGDPLNCTGACPWVTFQGEPALRFDLVLTAP